MKNKLQLAVIFFVCCLYTTSANVLKVPEDYSTIQSAINEANNGDTVLVAVGTFTENINFLGKDILVTSHYMFEDNTSFITSTIIDGSQPNHPDTASCVLFINGETKDAVLQGFTLTGGKGTRWEDFHIGGFYREGGGILIELSSPTIQFNLIEFNEATDKTNCTSAGGGAIRCGDGDPIIQNNVIANNQGRYGAGIVMNFATGTIRNNLIFQNTGGIDYGGSGIWSYSAGTTIIENNTIINNHSDLDGGGILIWSTSATIKNNIIWGNTSTTSGNQIKLRSGGSVDVTYSNVEGGWQGDGNIDTNPNFENIKLLLANGSLCIDAGDPDPQYNDPEGSPGMALWPAKGTVKNDMGAYGGPHSAVLSDFTVTSVNDDGMKGLPQGFYLEQNYPNPFNPGTTINYEIPKSSYVELKIFDMLGRVIKVLVKGERQAGKYEVNIDSESLGLPSGIYFYQLKTGEFVQTKKMVLMK